MLVYIPGEYSSDFGLLYYFVYTKLTVIGLPIRPRGRIHVKYGQNNSFGEIQMTIAWYIAGRILEK
jgi:hypothetical protein